MLIFETLCPNTPSFPLDAKVTAASSLKSIKQTRSETNKDCTEYNENQSYKQCFQNIIVNKCLNLLGKDLFERLNGNSK